jgi:uncharacterized protein YdbL (DUF1318 family)
MMVSMRLVSQLNPVFYNFTNENGLGSNTIYSFHQMSDGRMVIGHDNGLSFYNGKSFKTPKFERPIRSVYRFLELQNEELLCINFQGKNFSVYEEIVTIFDTSLIIKGFTENDNNTFCFNNDYIYQIEHSKELHKIIELTSYFTQVYKIQVFDHKIFVAGMLHNDFKLAAFSEKDFTLLLNEKMDFSPDFYVFKDRLYFFNYSASKLYEYDAKKLLLGLEVIRWSPTDKINFIYQLSNGFYLVGNYHGLKVYTEHWKLVAIYFEGTPISKAFEDSEGNIWLGTLNDGVYFIPHLDVLSYDVKVHFEKNQYISNSCSVNNNILVGTYNGHVKAINEKGMLIWETNLGFEAEVQAMHYDSMSNSVWVYCKKLIQLNASNGMVLNQMNLTSTKSIDINYNWMVCGTSLGVTSSKTNFYQTLLDHWVRNVLILNSEEVLLETNLGLKRWNVKTDLITQIHHPEKIEPEHLVSWKNRPLVKFEKSIYEVINDSLVLFEWQPSPSFYKMGVTKDFLYVIYTNEGFAYYDGAETGTYSNQDGLYKFLPINIHFVNNKWICVGERSIRILPKSIPNKKTAPTIRFSSIEGTFYQEDSIWTSSYRGNKFMLSGQLLPNLSDFGQGKVLYRMQGVIHDWTEAEITQKEYVIELDRLPYGNFVLEVKGENKRGFSSPIYTFSLYILTPFYLKWWFILLMALLIGLWVVLMVKWRIAILNKRNLAKLKKERLQTQALKSELSAIRAQMNPHLIFNSLSSIQTKILSNQSKDAYEHLLVFTKLLRQALEFSQREYISLKEELTFLSNYINLEFLRKDESFCWEIQIDEKVKTDKVMMPSLLLQPFAENAIIHGLMHSTNQKQLLVKVDGTEDGYLVTIEDNGIGRAASAQINQNRVREHTSFALKATNDRVPMINKSGKLQIRIEIVDLNPGTRVVVVVSNKI